MRSVVIAWVLVWLCLSSVVAWAQSPFESEVRVESIAAITADSASVEPLSERVAVFLTGRDPGERLGLRVHVVTDAKFHVVRIANSQQDQQQVIKSSVVPGSWIMFGQPGRYAITLVESDPEKGLWFTDLKADIVGEQPDEPGDPDQPTDPDEPNQPPGDYGQLIAIVDKLADDMDDPATRKALSLAYATAAKSLDGTTLAEAKVIVSRARFLALNARQGDSRGNDWRTGFLDPLEMELLRIGVEDVETYRAAISVIAEALGKE